MLRYARRLNSNKSSKVGRKDSCEDLSCVLKFISICVRDALILLLRILSSKYRGWHLLFDGISPFIASSSHIKPIFD